MARLEFSTRVSRVLVGLFGAVFLILLRQGLGSAAPPENETPQGTVEGRVVAVRAASLEVRLLGTSETEVYLSVWPAEPTFLRFGPEEGMTAPARPGLHPGRLSSVGEFGWVDLDPDAPLWSLETSSGRAEPPPLREVEVDAPEELGALHLGGPPGIHRETFLGPRRVRGLTEACPAVIIGWSRDYRRVGRLDLQAGASAATLELGRPSRVEGAVTTPTGESVGAGVQVWFRPERADLPDWNTGPAGCLVPEDHQPPARDPTHPIETDTEGRFGPVALSPGTWTLRVPGGSQQELEVGLDDCHRVRLEQPLE